MVSGRSAEDLPPGWKEHVKVTNGRKIKYYTHEERGLKLYSKKRVFCCDEVQPSQGTLQSLSEQKQESNTSDSEVVVEQNVSLEWLPAGWTVESRKRKNGPTAGSVYKTYVDPTSGYKFYSKPQVIRYLRSVNSDYTPEKQKQKQKRKRNQEVSGDKSSMQAAIQNLELIEDKSSLAGENNNSMARGTPMCLEIVVRSDASDDLPPGWVKELRARKSDRKKKDPYYIDPVYGYEFRSKKDAQRYLESGNIDSCVMKPKKNQLKFEDAIRASATTDCLKLDLTAFDDHGAGEPDTERSKETGTADPKSTAVDEKEHKKLNSEINGCGGSEHSCEIKIEGSKQSVEFNDSGAVSSPKSPGLHEQKHPEDRLDTKPQIESKKSKKRKPVSVPARSSKRLSGKEPEPVMVSSERALRAAVKKSAGKEANVSVTENKAASDELPLQLDTNQPSEVIADVPGTTLPETEMPNNIENPSLGQDVPEQAAGQAKENREEENPRSQDSHVWYPFGDSLSDPCYEFAFKTLTGELPLEDTLAFQNLFQQPIEAPSTQAVVSAGLPEIDTTSPFQNDAPVLDPVQNKAPPTEQLPSNSGINLASCSGFNCQQPSLETRSNDCETRVNS